MLERLRSDWLRWAAILVIAVASLLPARALVLCIGADGHVAIEVALAEGLCVDCGVGTEAEPSCCVPTPESACTCTDVELDCNSQPATPSTRAPVDLAPPARVDTSPRAELAAARRPRAERSFESSAPRPPRAALHPILRV